MFFKSTVLLLLFGLVRPQTKYCCTPPQWESRFNLITGGTNQGKPYFIQEYQNVSIDGNAHKVAASVSITTNDVTSHIQIIQDFDGGKQYSITNGNCQTSTLAPWTPKCVPDDAKLLTKTYFGTGNKKIAFDVYSFTMDVNTYIVDVASADCTPLYLTGHGSKNNVTGFSIGTYSNMTLGIKDPSVFDIPDSCKHFSFGANVSSVSQLLNTKRLNLTHIQSESICGRKIERDSINGINSFTANVVLDIFFGRCISSSDYKNRAVWSWIYTVRHLILIFDKNQLQTQQENSNRLNWQRKTVEEEKTEATRLHSIF